jgi:hypothetical protein
MEITDMEGRLVYTSPEFSANSVVEITGCIKGAYIIQPMAFILVYLRLF